MISRSMVMGLMLMTSALLGCVDPDAGMSELDERAQIVENLRELGAPEHQISVQGDLVLLGGDAVVSLAASRELLGLERPDGVTQERWRSGTSVSTAYSAICINGLEYTGQFSEALLGAITAYNALGLRIRLVHTTGSTAGCDATIRMRHTTGFSRQGRFPSNGAPYHTIIIGSTFINFDIPSIRTQILHMFGHAFGLMHADAENPNLSCGPGTGSVGGGAGDTPPVGGVGGIVIPGIPVATVGGSVMNTCYRAAEPGALTPSDRGMLNALY